MLSGRCYENESVPYKALDGVVDDLSRHLASIPRQDVESLLPPDVAALTRVFPVLLQVHAIAGRRRTSSPAAPIRSVCGDGHSTRCASCSAAWRTAGRSSSASTTCSGPTRTAPCCSRNCFGLRARRPCSRCCPSGARKRPPSRSCRALLERAGRDIWSAMSLDPLTEDEAQTLIGALLPADSMLTDEDRRRMTREAGGSPFVLEQLARYAGVNRMEPSHAPTFAEMFAARLGALSAEARRFLETLAICGRPMASDLVCDACGVARERQSLVAMLRASRFIRSSGSSERIETYHDRIRDVLAADIAPDAVRRIHGRMVQALVERRSDDCEALFEHYRGAGDSENASIQAGLAGEKAGAALAFDRAASFYRHALALSPASPTPHAWREGLADALANAGRPAEAAEAYLRAADGAGDLQRVELQRRGAEQFLIGGHIDRGLELIRTMLANMGMACREAPAPRCCRCCGGAHGSDGGGCSSCRGPPTTSMPIPSCAWTPAGRRPRGCCSWT